MTSLEVSKYWVPARAKLGLPPFFEGSVKLAAILGLVYPEIGYYSHIPMTPALQQKFEMLLGSHGDSIAKAMKAKRDL